MRAQFEELKQEALAALQSVTDAKQLEELEVIFLGRKAGKLTELMKSIKGLSDEEKRTVGVTANETKRALEKAFAHKRQELVHTEIAARLVKDQLDITQPALPRQEYGHLHPNTIVQYDLENLCTSMGFMVLDGPELESDYYNFEAVNIPANHPARESQDTFYIKNHPDWVMRTHTSSVQVRALQKYGVPLRAIVPGKCYRNESTDVRHEHTFYQLEGIVVDTDISFSHMKGVLEAVAKHLYGPETSLRLRPKFYPFVEPGVNGEVTCFLCKGQGCRVCKHSGWLEIFGAGMIHPNVLKEGKVDPKKYHGFAFGLGLTRLVMLKYGIEDVRLLESGDMRFLEQF